MYTLNLDLHNYVSLQLISYLPFGWVLDIRIADALPYIPNYRVPRFPNRMYMWFATITRLLEMHRPESAEGWWSNKLVGDVILCRLSISIN